MAWAQFQSHQVLVDGIDVRIEQRQRGVDFGQLLRRTSSGSRCCAPSKRAVWLGCHGGVISVITKAARDDETLGVGRRWHFDSFNQTAGPADRRAPFITVQMSPPACRRDAGQPLDVLAPGEHRQCRLYDNFTVSSQARIRCHAGLRPGPGRRYTNTTCAIQRGLQHLSAVPAAQQSASNTDEYSRRASAHLVSLDGGLNQTLGVAYTRNQTATLQPQTAESLI